MRAPRFELGTSTLSGWRSNQLSYARRTDGLLPLFQDAQVSTASVGMQLVTCFPAGQRLQPVKVDASAPVFQPLPGCQEGRPGGPRHGVKVGVAPRAAVVTFSAVNLPGIHP